MSKVSLVESKAQRWRALAVYVDGQEGLLYVGRSFSEVNENYDEPFFELLEEDERKRVQSIYLQKWIGTPDNGNWVTQRNLPIPDDLTMKITKKL